ncbi:hypothetical protein PITCH_A240025 [uncultured Desulfobacterium sp.]|uniref:Class II aldolase/adducin N-terminal domain-containing protein n=1 Tax=uncultured Desulfobacterium sp. TaxID=201089 RepID=A0A445MYF3_9BACT|nr:hypothetical protein PITCH_A240025 [uncultured Desulfobacterium sp.]
MFFKVASPMTTSDLMSPLAVDSFAVFCRTLYQRRLAAGIGGNVSARLRDKFLVMPSGVSMRDVIAEEIDEAAQVYVLTAGRASTIARKSVSRIHFLRRQT